MVEVQFVRMDKSIDVPTYAKEDDAAFDLRSMEDVVISPNSQHVVKTGLHVAIPKGYVGLVWDRSGLAAKNAMHTLAGVIDSGYRGEVGVVLRNFGKELFHVEKNMRIAQMLIQPIASAKLIEVEKLDDTIRGSGGFGSTGHK